MRTFTIRLFFDYTHIVTRFLIMRKYANNIFLIMRI